MRVVPAGRSGSSIRANARNCVMRFSRRPPASAIAETPITMLVIWEGFVDYQCTQRAGRRASVVDGYLDPALSRDNLELRTGALVLRLDFEGSRCIGLRYQRGGKDRHGARDPGR